MLEQLVETSLRHKVEMDSLDIDVDDILSSPTTQFGRVVVFSSVAMFCKLAMHFMNRTTVHDGSHAVDMLMERKDGRSLITVANHTRCGPLSESSDSDYPQEAKTSRSRCGRGSDVGGRIQPV